MFFDNILKIILNFDAKYDSSTILFHVGADIVLFDFLKFFHVLYMLRFDEVTYLLINGLPMTYYLLPAFIFENAIGNL